MSNLASLPRKRAGSRPHCRKGDLRRRAPFRILVVASSAVVLLTITTIAIFARTHSNRNNSAIQISAGGTSSGQTNDIRGGGKQAAPSPPPKKDPIAAADDPHSTPSDSGPSLAKSPTNPKPAEPTRPTELARAKPPALVRPPKTSDARHDQPELLGSVKYPRRQPNVNELRDQLSAVAEFGLQRDTDDPIVKNLIEKDKHRLGEARQIHPFAPVINDIETLPLLMGSDCKVSATAAKSLQTRSRRLREYMFGVKKASDLQTQLAKDEGGYWVAPAAIPTLVQILQTEADDFRLLLVELLAKTPGRAASRALANRAVFDLSSDVRQTAIRALRERTHKEYRDVLIGGLRHPWPVAADFASAALVGVNDRYAIPNLVKLLDEPSPSAPFTVTEGNEQGHYVREMVRINHNQNCILCHAVSVNENEFVRAAVPDPKAPLPPPFSPAYYRERFSKDARLFVRADVTYLRQDFSLPQYVGGSDPSRQVQRFDFCVRIRALSNDEWAIKRLKPVDNPQREAVLFALRELSGEDRGSESPNWRPIATRFSN